MSRSVTCEEANLPTGTRGGAGDVRSPVNPYRFGQARQETRSLPRHSITPTPRQGSIAGCTDTPSSPSTTLGCSSD